MLILTIVWTKFVNFATSFSTSRKKNKLKQGENGFETWALIARLTIRKMSRSNTCKKLLSQKTHPACKQ